MRYLQALSGTQPTCLHCVTGGQQFGRSSYLRGEHAHSCRAVMPCVHYSILVCDLVAISDICDQDSIVNAALNSATDELLHPQDCAQPVNIVFHSGPNFRAFTPQGPHDVAPIKVNFDKEKRTMIGFSTDP